LLHGKTTENKSYYDFVIEFNESGGVAVRGASVKSKELKNLRSYPACGGEMRAHLEISNSSAKDWRACIAEGLSEGDFRNQKQAEKFGAVILARQQEERELSQQTYLLNSQTGGNKWFEESECIFISVLYSPPDDKGQRAYLISAFSIILPTPEKWEFRKSRLVGLDSCGEILCEWYALSGSQFKFYPRIGDRMNGTELFVLPKPAYENLRAKAARMFGD
jgi:hypothetical protein